MMTRWNNHDDDDDDYYIMASLHYISRSNVRLSFSVLLVYRVDFLSMFSPRLVQKKGRNYEANFTNGYRSKMLSQPSYFLTAFAAFNAAAAAADNII